MDADKLAAIDARGSRVRQLKDELGPLQADQVADIHELHEDGWTQASIALRLGVSATRVSHVINGVRPSSKWPRKSG